MKNMKNLKNMKKLSKRGLVLLLATIMCLSRLGIFAFAADECVQPDTDTVICSCGANNWSEWKVTATGPSRAATCKEDGFETQGARCEECGKTETKQVIIPATGNHEWGEWTDMATGDSKEATCNGDGFKTQRARCEVCGKTETKQVIIPATGNHEWGEWTDMATGDSKEATCAEEGFKTQSRTCNGCGNEETQMVSIPATGNHECDEWIDMATGDSKAATCNEDGFKTQRARCKVCGQMETKQVIIPATGNHEWSEWTDMATGDSKAATCNEDGFKTQRARCKVCGQIETKQVIIPATGKHIYVDGSCTDCGIEEPEKEEETKVRLTVINNDGLKEVAIGDTVTWTVTMINNDDPEKVTDWIMASLENILNLKEGNFVTVFKGETIDLIRQYVPIEPGKSEVLTVKYTVTEGKAGDIVQIPLNFYDTNPLGATASTILEYKIVPTLYTVAYRWENFPDDVEEDLPEAEFYTEGDKVTVDTTYTSESTITKNGETYAFSGWTTLEPEGLAINGEFVMPAQAVTISGTWTKREALKSRLTVTNDGLKEVEIGDTVTWEVTMTNNDDPEKVTDWITAALQNILSLKEENFVAVFQGQTIDLTRQFIPIEPGTSEVLTVKYTVTEGKAGDIVQIPLNFYDTNPLGATASTILEYKIVPTRYTVTYKWENLPDGVEKALPEAGSYAEGDKVTVDTTYTSESTITRDGETYAFSGWMALKPEDLVINGEFVMPDQDVTISGTWIKTAVPSTEISVKEVRYLVQWLDKDGNMLKDAEVRGPEAIGAEVKVTDDDKKQITKDDGSTYTFDADYEGNLLEGTLKAITSPSDMVVLKLHFDKTAVPSTEIIEKEVRYLVQWLDKDGNMLKDAEVRGPEAIGAEVEVMEADKAQITKDGSTYTFDTDYSQNILSGKLEEINSPENMLVLKLYFDKVEVPADPVGPANPAEPTNPDPTTPTVPNQPTEPETPVFPTTPDEPTIPSEPVVPGTEPEEEEPIVVPEPADELEEEEPVVTPVELVPTPEVTVTPEPEEENVDVPEEENPFGTPEIPDSEDNSDDNPSDITDQHSDNPVNDDQNTEEVIDITEEELPLGTPDETPKTGDASMTMLWVVLFLLSAGGMAVLYIPRRKYQ